jgi:hypothetical protein
MIGGALYWQLKQANSDSGPAAVTEPADHSFTLEELARCDGKVSNHYAH